MAESGQRGYRFFETTTHTRERPLPGGPRSSSERLRSAQLASSAPQNSGCLLMRQEGPGQLGLAALCQRLPC
jgi:hypothetical protein